MHSTSPGCGRSVADANITTTTRRPWPVTFGKDGSNLKNNKQLARHLVLWREKIGSSSIPPRYRPLIQAQQAIGWDQLWRGRLAFLWTTSLHSTSPPTDGPLLSSQASGKRFTITGMNAILINTITNMDPQVVVVVNTQT